MIEEAPDIPSVLFYVGNRGIPGQRLGAFPDRRIMRRSVEKAGKFKWKEGNEG